MRWDEKYSTGWPKIDDQHRRLFEILGELERMSGDGFDATKGGVLVGFLDAYIRQHFNFEEMCMFRAQCPMADDNKASHAKFVRAFEELKRRFERDGATPALLGDMETMVRLWITNHILRIDVKLKGLGV